MAKTSGKSKTGAGRLMRFEVDGRRAYVIVPTGRVDLKRRWVWYAPSWLAVQPASMVTTSLDTPWPEDGPWPRENMPFDHSYYVPHILAAGFHIGGVDVGVSCGSPKGVAVSHHLYQELVSQFGLHPQARLLAQSNGGLIHYSWAIEHPGCVDRIFGMFPVTDMSTWPGLDMVCGPGSRPPASLGYGLTPAELETRLDEFNPIARLAPLAHHDVKVLHIHGDADDVVPLQQNSVEFAQRYEELGGDMELVIVPGGRHAGEPPFYRSERALEFLLD
jgi:hypothetical protein